MEIRMKRNIKIAVAAMIMFAMTITMLMPAEVSAASKPGQVKSLKVSSKSYNSLKISWKKVKGAKGYQVYRATSKNGKYKKVKTTKSTSYTNGKLTTGKKYYYKVRAYKGKKYGKYSSKKYGTPKLKTPSLKASAASSSAVKLSWGKVSGAKGYQVYRATSKGGKYTKVKTTSSAAYTNTGLAASRTYYYKVRAYRKVGKSTKYSSYSAVRPAKTKAAKPSHTHKYVAKKSVPEKQALELMPAGICNGCRYTVKKDIREFTKYSKNELLDMANKLGINDVNNGSSKLQLMKRLGGWTVTENLSEHLKNQALAGVMKCGSWRSYHEADAWMYGYTTKTIPVSKWEECSNCKSKKNVRTEQIANPDWEFVQMLGYW